jgi:hypothetical protein
MGTAKGDGSSGLEPSLWACIAHPCGTDLPQCVGFVSIQNPMISNVRNVHAYGDGPVTMLFAHGFGCDQFMREISRSRLQ